MNKIFRLIVVAVALTITSNSYADSSLPLKPAGFNWSMNAQQFANKCKSLGGKSFLKKPEGSSVFEYSMFCTGLNLPGILKGYPTVMAGYLKSGRMGRFAYVSTMYQNKIQWKNHISSTIDTLTKLLGEGNLYKEDDLTGDMKLASNWKLENGTIQLSIFLDENGIANDSIWIDTIEANNDMANSSEDDDASSNLIQM